MDDFARTERNKVKRLPQRAQYDRETIYRIVDEAPISHVGFTQEDQPVVIPDAPRPDRRHALFPRRTREPAAQADRRGASHVRRVYGAGRPRARPFGVSPLGELSFRGRLRHGQARGIGRGEAGRAGSVDRAHRAGPLGGCAPAEPEGVGCHVRHRAAHRERVRQDPHRPAGRRRGGLRAAGLGWRRAAAPTGVGSDRRPETERRHRRPELHLELHKRRAKRANP